MTDRPPASSRKHPLPYGRQTIEQADIDAVVAALGSDWLTTGPRVARFERAFAAALGAEHAVAVANGTAALHAAVAATGVGPGDEVLVPTMTFAASANAVVYQGATPVFVDVDPETLLIDPQDAANRVTPATRALIGVDFAGQPCDWDALNELARRHDLITIDDASHAPGATFGDRSVGTLADLNTFSFHPVKHMTTAEGGMVTTDDAHAAALMRRFRNHGLTTDHKQRDASGTWEYDMVDLGFNYRLSDLHAALGLAQLERLGPWVERRRALAKQYDEALRHVPDVEPLRVHPDRSSSYHIYVVRVADAATRARAFAELRAAGVQANVHYKPVHLHGFYQRSESVETPALPNAEAAYQRILTLPLFPGMSDTDVSFVVDTLAAILSKSPQPLPRTEANA